MNFNGDRMDLLREAGDSFNEENRAVFLYLFAAALSPYIPERLWAECLAEAANLVEEAACG